MFWEGVPVQCSGGLYWNSVVVHPSGTVFRFTLRVRSPIRWLLLQGAGAIS